MDIGDGRAVDGEMMTLREIRDLMAELVAGGRETFAKIQATQDRIAETLARFEKERSAEGPGGGLEHLANVQGYLAECADGVLNLVEMTQRLNHLSVELAARAAPEAGGPVQ